MSVSPIPAEAQHHDFSVCFQRTFTRRGVQDLLDLVRACFCLFQKVHPGLLHFHALCAGTDDGIGIAHQNTARALGWGRYFHHPQFTGFMVLHYLFHSSLSNRSKIGFYFDANSSLIQSNQILYTLAIFGFAGSLGINLTIWSSSPVNGNLNVSQSPLP